MLRFTRFRYLRYQRLLLILLLSGTFLCLTGCGEHIADPDPTSFELKTLSREKLADSSTSHRSSGVSSVSKRYNITILTQYEKIDFDYLKLTGGKTSGVKGILATSLKKGQTLRLDCASKVDAGNLGLIVLAPDRKILHQFALNQADSFQFTAEAAGIYFVRMGAESFSGEIELTRTIR